jgi:hypothetical protein
MTPKDEIKKQAMSAIAGVKSVAQVGTVTVTAGVAAYAAHMRQMDRNRSHQRRLPLRTAIRDLYE